MSDLGKMLQQARLEKGISLDELQDSTKIRKRYLQAIEDGEFNVLPGNFYVRAFIKSYAEAVGLNPDDVLKLYGNVIPETYRVARPADPVRTKTKTKKILKNTDRITRWAATILVITFFALIVAVIYYYVIRNYESNDNRIVDNGDRLTNQVEAPGNEGVVPLPPTNEEQTENGDTDPEEPPEPTPELQYVTTDGPTRIYTLTNADTINLQLRIIDSECWISVREGNSEGKELFQGKLVKDDVRSWETASSLYIRLGFPISSEISVNGIDIDKEMMNSRNPINFQINLGQQESNI